MKEFLSKAYRYYTKLVGWVIMLLFTAMIIIPVIKNAVEDHSALNIIISTLYIMGSIRVMYVLFRNNNYSIDSRDSRNNSKVSIEKSNKEA